MPTRDQTIDVAIGDGHIAGTLVTPGTQIPGVLFVHGWGGSRQQYLTRAREVAALGCVCLTFDLRGHAETRTQYEAVSREHNLVDVVAAEGDGLPEHRVVRRGLGGRDVERRSPANAESGAIHERGGRPAVCLSR